MTKPLLGKVRLTRTRLEIRAPEGVTQVAPLTPEQAVIMLADWANYEGTSIRNDERFALLMVAPAIVGDQVFASIKVGEASNARGFTILLEPKDFEVVWEQFDRTRRIMKDEAAAPVGVAPPPHGEGRAPPRAGFDKGDRDDGNGTGK